MGSGVKESMEDKSSSVCVCQICRESLDTETTKVFTCSCEYISCISCAKRILTEFDAKCPGCQAPFTGSHLNSSRHKSSSSPSSSHSTPAKGRRKQNAGVGVENDYGRSKINFNVLSMDLVDVRVIQHHLVYTIGVPPSIAKEDILRSNDYFGQYGHISKVVIGKHSGGANSKSAQSVYITFSKASDAENAIAAVNGYWYGEYFLKATYGTTKYCHSFLKKMRCTNASCLYLHQLANESECFTKEEMANIGRQQFPKVPDGVSAIKAPEETGEDYGRFPPKGFTSTWTPADGEKAKLSESPSEISPKKAKIRSSSVAVNAWGKSPMGDSKDAKIENNNMVSSNSKRSEDLSDRFENLRVEIDQDDSFNIEEFSFEKNLDMNPLSPVSLKSFERSSNNAFNRGSSSRSLTQQPRKHSLLKTLGGVEFKQSDFAYREPVGSHLSGISESQDETGFENRGILRRHHSFDVSGISGGTYHGVL